MGGETWQGVTRQRSLRSNPIPSCHSFAYLSVHVKQVVAFGHLAINGAIQNASNTRYMGGLAPVVFAPFRRTFSGHFHLHHSHPYNITYVGAPLQFNFGDAGQERGICLYDTETDQFQYIVNPHHRQFIKIKSHDVDEAIKTHPELFKDTFVLVQVWKFVATNSCFLLFTFYSSTVCD